MTIQRAIDLIDGNEYILVSNTNQIFNVVFSKERSQLDYLFFTDVISGTYFGVSSWGFSSGVEQYTCYSEEDMDCELIFQPNDILNPSVKFMDLIGKSFSEVIRKDDSIILKNPLGTEWHITHVQECCEQVYLDDVVGDLQDLQNTPILDAKETSAYVEEVGECYFYDFRTIKGSVMLRFMHEHGSNTMYSARASLVAVNR